MNTQTIHGQIKTGLLALVFVSSWLLKTGHALFINHVHRDVPVCEAAHDGSAKHLHDERYNPDDCSVCAFIFAIPDLVSVSFSLKQPALPVWHSLPVPTAPCLTAGANLTHPRGPPAGQTYENRDDIFEISKFYFDLRLMIT